MKLLQTSIEDENNPVLLVAPSGRTFELTKKESLILLRLGWERKIHATIRERP